MNKIILFIFSLFCLPTLAATTDELLLKVDNAIEQRAAIKLEKDKKISLLKRELAMASAGQRGAILLEEELFKEYSIYNTDSALFHANQMWTAALGANDKEHLAWAARHRVAALTTSGMFKEASELLATHRTLLHQPPYRQSYYHLCRTLYGYLTDYAASSAERNEYRALTDLYRDSLLATYPPSAGLYKLMSADKLTAHNQAAKAVSVLLTIKETPDRHFNAACSFTLGEAYEQLGNSEKALDAYLVSATHDLLTGTREYISLRKAATLLFKRGDVARAYRYLSVCMEDAKACNCRLRIVEILDVFPVINEAYQQQQQRHQRLLIGGIIAISLLSVLLFAAFRYAVKKRKQQAETQKALSEANHQLKNKNEQLLASNREVKQKSDEIAENSYLKEIYIARYMDQCSTYLEKMEQFRRHVRKVADYGSKQELKAALTSSSKEIEEELSEFYSSFDDTFLELFPSFVSDFNALLQEGDAILPKQGQKLNTELRIFALIRLGITDSVKIAQFLRYSTTTIYNYRTRTRNKARGNRDELEKKVMNIGKAQPLPTPSL